MAGPPIKFRCSHCNQMLGVARSKAGGTVSCPKCSAELRVPEPFGDPPSRPSSSTSPIADLLGQVEPAATGSDDRIDPDLLDIRPEDIRAQGVVDTPPREPRNPPPSTPDADDAGIDLQIEPEPSPPPTSPASRSKVIDRPKPKPKVVEIDILSDNAAADEAPKDAIVPPIRLEEPSGSRRAPAPVAARSIDLVLPRTVVAAWSLLVLLAVLFAFIAGLLAGHFLWRVH